MRNNSPFRWKSLNVPSKELAELICAAPIQEQTQLTERVKFVMDQAYLKKEALFAGCKFRGYEFVLCADPKDGPVLISIEDFTRVFNEGIEEANQRLNA